MRKIAKNLLKNKYFWTLVVLLFPFVFLALMPNVLNSIFYIGGKMPPSTYLINIDTENYKVTFNNYMTLFIAILQTCVTAFFSYMVWISSKEANNLSIKIHQQELNKEKVEKREIALTIYYEIIIGLDNIRLLYRSYCLHEKVIAPTRLIYNKEWTSKISKLSEFLTYKQINWLNEIYSKIAYIDDLICENEEIENNHISEIEKAIKQIIDEDLYEYYTVLSLNDSFIGDIVNIRIASLIISLKYLITSGYSVNDRKLHNIEIKDEMLNIDGYVENNKLQGKTIVYDKSGNELFNGEFNEGEFIHGERKIFRNNHSIYEVKHENNNCRKTKIVDLNNIVIVDGKFDDKKLFTGYKQQYDNKVLKYKGEFINGKYNGEGIKYNDSETIEGIWKNGRIINGIAKGVKIADSEGYDYFEEQAYIEQQEELANDEAYQEQRAMSEALYDLTAPDYDEYANFQIINGRYKLIEDSEWRNSKY